MNTKNSKDSFVKDFDFLLLGKILMMCAFSIIILYSTALGNFNTWAFKQAITVCAFIPIILIVANIKFNSIYSHAYLIYLISLLLLVLASLYGHKAMGAQRWLRLGFINFQPSEMMKIGLILALARYMHDLHSNEIGKIKNLLIPLILTVFPVFLILKQPNLGTAVILIVIAAAILFIAGVRIWKFIAIIILVAAMLPVIWFLLHDYQRQRVLTFLNPEADSLGAGYNIIQSIIAIGSGGFFGKGFLQGSQSQLSFLPEKQTDFILSVIAEEFGFFGIIVVLVLTISIIISCYRIAYSSNNQFFRLIVVGITTSFTFHAIINAGMISGLLPVVGMPYPLLSYGGSNLAAFLIGFSLILNPYLRNMK